MIDLATQDELGLVLACPAQKREQLRSGTWATIRYARKTGVKMFVIFPDGTWIVHGAFLSERENGS